MTVNEMNGVLGHLCAHNRLNWARRTSRGWWDDWDDTALLAVWGRARYLSITEALHNIESLRVSGGETFCFCETWRPEWGSNPSSPIFQAGSFNHCTRAPNRIVNTIQVNTIHWGNVVLMLVHRLRCWSNIKTILHQYNAFDGIDYDSRGSLL